MNNAVWAVPGLMPPTAPNEALRITAPENGSLKLCLYCGKSGDVVNFSAFLRSFRGGVVKDPSYDFGRLEECPAFVKGKAHWAQFLIQSEVLPDDAIVPFVIVHGSWPVPVTERPDIPEADRLYWILDLPAGSLPQGDTVVDVVVNGRLRKYHVHRPAFSIHLHGRPENHDARERHQLGEELDIMLYAGDAETVHLGLKTEGVFHRNILPDGTEFRASFEMGNGLSENVPCERHGDILHLFFPAIDAAGRGLWRAEYKMWQDWVVFCSGDLIIKEARYANN